jgi:hypothetical protein
MGRAAEGWLGIDERSLLAQVGGQFLEPICQCMILG